ncbi:FOG: Transposon-encoded proteins with TYA, reverse transcriptase, integrase domains in various combinations [Plasmopara halstedii]|uniref:FOG: Transposon-encoded proteins with TYA, reverse transcriptase, integrase domains in various combinations n=1 Tax=Plasmopara halstedii TaxID=4781 RepID=A0A0N7L6T1_PLAHL|nr:FOG: Transposon-encoded proteins with TYA, reverse transcriptase, integrase domains in various combinations [Plasmopara halstedii]CEG45139.1 FOG: Transposon-encoded proteins with TYA, reverse transcriptase, integrase domains in various combinations [Plasmopara halstedii]|eukprot:XP_024581508.1 FOG: Transposon-encoded proteins with TYA, reverse transcriptase, integrase domains in various combinations [Plasmopara halstedii]
MAESQDLQNADEKGRDKVESFKVGDQVLLNSKSLPTYAASTIFRTKLRPLFIGLSKVVAKQGLAYTLNVPKRMRTHSVFYMGLLKPYRDPAQVNAEALAPERIPRALGHPEADPAIGFEHGVQQPPFPMVPSAPPSHAATHLPALRLGVAPTECGCPQGDAAGARRASNHQERPHSDMLLQHDAQRRSDHEELRPQGLEEHHESPPATDSFR